MKRLLCASLVLVVAAACGGSTVSSGNDPDGGADGGGGGADSGNNILGEAGVGGPLDAGGSKDAGLPAAVDIQFDNCPAFTPSGGDPVGAWDYTGACVDTAMLADLGAGCMGPDKPTIKSAKGKVQGRIVFTATEVARNVVTKTDAVVTVAKTCFPAQFQAQSCASLGTLLASQVPGASCVDGADVAHCDCNITITGGQSGTNKYTKSATQLTLDDGSIYDFSVKAKTLQYTQTTAAMGMGKEPGISTANME